MDDASDPPAPLSPDDFAVVSRLVLDSWTSAVDRDWSVPAGTLEWSCWKTAEHTVDCVFSYAFFLASRATTAYPPFDELRASPSATPADLVDGLRAATNLLSAAIATAPQGTRAIIRQRPAPTTGSPIEFAARGALELALHGHDIASGLGVRLRPDDAICRRLFDSTATWPGVAQRATAQHPRTGDPWADLIVRSGRPRPT
jgi:uncharacterized protein (TIGR03083 family)